MRNQKGQALIIAIFGLAFAIVVVSQAVIVAITLGKNSHIVEDAQAAYYTAQSGLETSVLKLERSPTGCSGTDNLTVGQNNATVTYSFSSPTCTLVSTGQVGTVVKKLQASATIGANSLITVCCWKEIR